MKYSITICSIGFCLALVTPISLAADEANDLSKVRCTRFDGNPGYCARPRNCRQTRHLLEEMKSREFTPKQMEYIKGSGSSDCCNKTICCEYLAEEGIRKLQDQECGLFSMLLVYGGLEIKLMSRPWLALLKFRESIGFTCGGSLIHKRFVLTAAHCFEHGTLESVRFGEHQLSTDVDCRFLRGRVRCAPPVEDFSVEEVYIHPKFTDTEGYNDIAIVKLSSEVEFKQHIRPICLPINEELQRKASEMANFMLTGWGKTENSTFSDVPMEINIPQQDSKKCSEFYHKEIRITQLCAGREDRDSCNGDSGSPLVAISYFNESQRFIQLGIVSGGTEKCFGNVPAIYTRISSFIPWIVNIIAGK